MELATESLNATLYRKFDQLLKAWLFSEAQP